MVNEKGYRVNLHKALARLKQGIVRKDKRAILYKYDSFYSSIMKELWFKFYPYTLQGVGKIHC